MPGNSSRRGAIKKTGKGNPTAGSGGRVRRGLEGKGPTPKAKDREGHVAYKKRQRAVARAAKDFATADTIRDRIKAAGIEVEDTPDGPKWSI